MHTGRHPPLPQHGLESGDLVQARGLLDEVLEARLLLVGELYAGHAGGQAAGGEAVAVAGQRGVEGLGLDAHDLGGELGRLGSGAEQRRGLHALGVLDLLEV